MADETASEADRASSERTSLEEDVESEQTTEADYQKLLRVQAEEDEEESWGKLGEDEETTFEEEEELEEEQEPFVSVFERLDAPRTLLPPVEITEALLKAISVHLGQIRLCWPKKEKIDIDFMPNVILPDGYLQNTNKEKLLLLYCENFRQHYHQLYPNRKPLLLAADNVVGQRKMVCTTLRPTTLSSPNLSTWQELAAFVADYIHYAPVDPPCTLDKYHRLQRKIGHRS